METMDVVVGQLQTLAQLRGHQPFGFVHLGLAHGQGVERHMVETLLVTLHGFVAMQANIVEHAFHGGAQCGVVHLGPTGNLIPNRLRGVLNGSHNGLL